MPLFDHIRPLQATNHLYVCLKNILFVFMINIAKWFWSTFVCCKGRHLSIVIVEIGLLLWYILVIVCCNDFHWSGVVIGLLLGSSLVCSFDISLLLWLPLICCYCQRCSVAMVSIFPCCCNVNVALLLLSLLVCWLYDIIVTHCIGLLRTKLVCYDLQLF